MNPLSRRIVTIAAGAALTMAVAGGVVAGTQSSDEEALAPTRQAANASIEDKVAALVKQMTTKEKLEQVQLLADWQATDAEAKAGLGGVFSQVDPAKINHLQHVAVEQSRLHIPILFAFDTIHGYRTVFPIPLGAASSFDPSSPRPTPRSAPASRRPWASSRSTARWSTSRTNHAGAGSPRAAARTRTSGRRSPRPGSRVTRARDYSRRTRWPPASKHFAAYGAARGRPRVQHHRHVRVRAAQPLPAAVQGRGGRRRGHRDVLVQRDQRRPRLREPRHRDRAPQERVGLRRLRRVRLHRRRRAAGVPAGQARTAGRAATVSRPTVPAPARSRSTRAPTRRWSARTSATSASSCSPQRRDPDVAAQRRGPADPAGEVPRRPVRPPVRRPDEGRPTRPASSRPDDRAAARNAANESMVLLKNDGATLPLDPSEVDRRDRAARATTSTTCSARGGARAGTPTRCRVFTGIRAQDPNTTFTPGCTPSRQRPARQHPGRRMRLRRRLRGRRRRRQAADQVVLALGETREMSGESAARSDIDLPGHAAGADRRDQGDRQAVRGGAVQRPAADAGRRSSRRHRRSSRPGSRASRPATRSPTRVRKDNPGGKLSVSFPRASARCRSTTTTSPPGGRATPRQKWNSRYRDLPSCDPLYPFGYGLSYTTFTCPT